MELLVYKGFDEKTLEKLDIKPLIENEIKNKFDIFNLNEEYEEDIELNILQKRNNKEKYWITYEEFTLGYDYFILRAKDGKLSIEIIDNNIYPGIYPIYSNIDLDLISKYKMQREDESNICINEKIEIINKFYTNILSREEGLYGIYHNFELPYNLQIKNIKKFYDENIKVEKSKDCDYLVKIGDEIEDFIVYEQDILNNNYDKIAYKMFCNTEISNTILRALKALLIKKNKNALYEFIGEYIADNTIYNELKAIGKRMTKNEQFDFRNIEFYKNPDISNEMEKISQSTIMEYIITESEKAYNDESYRDIFMTAPTGAGKSLIFQIPSIYLSEKYNKLILIIEPLKGLMTEQKEKLEASGYTKARFINSDIPTTIEREQILTGVKNGKINILYVSPETLLSHSIEGLIGDRELGLVIIDEAHIVTTWGVGFRPDYWYLGAYLKKLREKKDKTGGARRYHKFPIFACTATAVNGGKDDTVGDTILSLYMNDPIVKIGTPKRKNISFQINNHVDNSFDEFKVKKVEVTQKRIEGWIANKNKTIIYCPYKSIAHNMYKGSGEFRSFYKFKENTGVYTGNYVDDEVDKNEMKKDFEIGKKNIIYATKAFGMGMDIPDIQNVYHYAVTGNLSDYIQEIGRAARDENIQGKAIVDYFDGDMKYMNSLFGMSQIKQYQVKKCLAIIYDTYKNHNRRNFLINPKMFEGVFGKDLDAEDLDVKLKIVLLMIEKDFNENNRTRVMFSRPCAMFTKSYIALDEKKENEILNGKYGRYLKKIYDEREKRVITNANRDNGHVYTSSDIGDIFEIDLKGIWENEYSSLSFQYFKYLYYSKSDKIAEEISKYMYPRVKLKITTKQGKMKDLYKLVSDEIDYVTEILNTFERNYFAKDEFKKKIMRRYHNSVKAEIIANSYLEIVDARNQCVKTRENSDGIRKYQINDGRLRYLAKDILKANLMRKFRYLDKNEYEQYFAESQEDNNLLKLLSIFDLISYEIEGGNTPEIYIFLNTPDKIKNIVEDKVYYKNSYVEKARERHYRAVKILDYFFRKFNNDKNQMWDFVERYFLGEDIESEIDEETGNNENHSKTSVLKYIDSNSENVYSLEDYSNWDMIIDNIIEDKYKYFCEILKNHNKRKPDYAYTDIVINKKNISTLIIYVKENIIIMPENIGDETIQICEKKGWKIFSIDKIEENLDLIGDAENG